MGFSKDCEKNFSYLISLFCQTISGTKTRALVLLRIIFNVKSLGHSPGEFLDGNHSTGSQHATTGTSPVAQW